MSTISNSGTSGGKLCYVFNEFKSIFINFALIISAAMIYFNKKLSRTAGVMLLCVSALIVSGCRRSGSDNLPDNFKSLPTDQQMDILMKDMTPDSVASYICDAAMGKKYDTRIELAKAKAYAYEHYNEAEIVQFDEVIAQYKESLPLHEKVRFTKLEGSDDLDMYGYELGLAYVGTIREEKKDINQISDELNKLMKECQLDKDFYKKFMKGFKTALNYDRHHDLDDNIYLKFISYPDSIR